MTAFLWTLIVLTALSCVGKLYWLATGTMPPRNPGVEALDVFINACMIVWAVVLLVRA